MASPIYINNGETYGTSAGVTAGRVGIGTTNPADSCEIYANGADVALRVHEDSGSNEAKLHLRSGTADWEIANYSGQLKFGNVPIMLTLICLP